MPVEENELKMDLEKGINVIQIALKLTYCGIIFYMKYAVKCKQFQ